MGQVGQDLISGDRGCLALEQVPLESKPAPGGKSTATQVNLSVVTPPALLPSFPLQVTLQDYHLPDSDDDEDEETAIQRVLQQVGPALPT